MTGALRNFVTNIILISNHRYSERIVASMALKFHLFLIALLAHAVGGESANSSTAYIFPNDDETLSCPNGSAWFQSNKSNFIVIGANPVNPAYQNHYSLTTLNGDYKLTIVNMNSELHQNELVCCSKSTNCNRASLDAIVIVMLQLASVSRPTMQFNNSASGKMHTIISPGALVYYRESVKFKASCVILEPSNPPASLTFIKAQYQNAEIQTAFTTAVEQNALYTDNGTQIRCEAQNNVGRDKSKMPQRSDIYTLILLRVSDVEIQDKNGLKVATMSLNEGQSVTLNCSANCVPSCRYQWTCTNISSGILFSMNGNLLFIPWIDGTTAICRCNVSTIIDEPYLSSTAQVTFNMSYPPEISIKPLIGTVAANAEVNEGTKDFNLTCIITTPGIPPVYTYNWKLNDLSISTQSVLSFVPGVMRNDAGNYTCFVTNNAGVSQSTYQLSVNYIDDVTMYMAMPDDREFALARNSSVIREGDTVRLNCSATCLSSCGIPSWSCADISGTRAFSLSTPNTLVAVQRYLWCQCTFQLGTSPLQKTASNYIMFNVTYPPFVQLSLGAEKMTGSVVVSEQTENVQLFCNISGGNPSMLTVNSIRWKKNGRLIKNGDRQKFSFSKPISKDDSAIYSCTVWTIGGVQTSSLTLSVSYGPIWNADVPPALAGREGDRARLECAVDSYPEKLYYRWFRSTAPGDVLLRSVDYILLIQAANGSDFGTYICETNNTLKAKNFSILFGQEGFPDPVSNCIPKLSDAAVSILCTPGNTGVIDNSLLFFMELHLDKSLELQSNDEMPEFNVNLTGIAAGTYTAYVTVGNSFGNSTSTAVSFTINANINSAIPTTEALQLRDLLASTFSTILVLLLAIGVAIVVILKFRQPMEKNKFDSTGKGPATRKSFSDNERYASNGQRSLPSIPTPHPGDYLDATLKTDKYDIYEDPPQEYTRNPALYHTS